MRDIEKAQWFFIAGLVLLLIGMGLRLAKEIAIWWG